MSMFDKENELEQKAPLSKNCQNRYRDTQNQHIKHITCSNVQNYVQMDYGLGGNQLFTPRNLSNRS